MKVKIRTRDIIQKNKKIIHSLYFSLTLTFVIILLIVIISSVIYFSYKSGNNKLNIKSTMQEEQLLNDSTISNLKSAAICGLIVGTTLVFMVVTHIIRPLIKINDATKKVAQGDFDVHVKIKRKDEIGELANNFNTMVKELNSIEILRKDYISNVSHEIKTPIASIQGFAQLLEDDNLNSSEKKEYLNIILEETNRLSKISSNIIKLSKFQNQKIVTHKKEYRLDEQIRKAIIMLEKYFNEKNIMINFESKEITVFEDEDLIMEIWINLLSNAIKYTNNNGTIDVITKEHDNLIEVQISDNGIGIEKDKIGKIFEKFYQVQKSHSSDGSGLGLAIVKRIIELVNGEISVESEVGKGTTFFITIPKRL